MPDKRDYLVRTWSVPGERESVEVQYRTAMNMAKRVKKNAERTGDNNPSAKRVKREVEAVDEWLTVMQSKEWLSSQYVVGPIKSQTQMQTQTQLPSSLPEEPRTAGLDFSHRNDLPVMKSAWLDRVTKQYPAESIRHMLDAIKASIQGGGSLESTKKSLQNLAKAFSLALSEAFPGETIPNLFPNARELEQLIRNRNQL